jgi:hypothetical protein
VPNAVQVILDEGNLAIQMSEIDEWLRARSFTPNVVQTRMTEHRVQLTLHFAEENEASAFADAFSGAVLV